MPPKKQTAKKQTKKLTYATKEECDICAHKDYKANKANLCQECHSTKQDSEFLCNECWETYIQKKNIGETPADESEYHCFACWLKFSPWNRYVDKHLSRGRDADRKARGADLAEKRIEAKAKRKLKEASKKEKKRKVASEEEPKEDGEESDDESTKKKQRYAWAIIEAQEGLSTSRCTIDGREYVDHVDGVFATREDAVEAAGFPRDLSDADLDTWTAIRFKVNSLAGEDKCPRSLLVR